MNHMYINSAIISLIVQYFILISIGILSTFIFYLAYILGIGSAQVLDITMNICCVLLTGSLYTNIYMGLCGLCHNKLQIIYLESIQKQITT